MNPYVIQLMNPCTLCVVQFLSYDVLYISCSKSVNLFSSACVLVEVYLGLFYATFFFQIA